LKFFRRIVLVIILLMTLIAGYLFWYFRIPTFGSGELSGKTHISDLPTTATVSLKKLQSHHIKATPKAAEKIHASDTLSKEAVSEYRLPPLGKSFIDDEQQLLAASARGHGRATCLIAYEVAECQYFFTKNLSVEEELKQRIASQKLTPKAVELLKPDLIARERRCAGMDKQKLKEEKPWKMLLEAGLQGHVPSMVFFTQAPLALDPISMLTDPEWAAAYKTYAPGLLLEGARYGNATAIRSLVEAYSGESSHPLSPIKLFQPFDNDALMALRYTYILENMPGVKTEWYHAYDRGLIATVKQKLIANFTQTEIAAAQNWALEFSKMAIENRKAQRYQGEQPPEANGQTQGGWCYR
jgi:hypothetical protein